MGYVLRIATIVTVAGGLAATVNAIRPNGIAWYVPRQAVYPQPTPEQLAAAIDRSGVIDAIGRGAVLIDARPEKAYLQGHIPGSIAMPASADGEPADIKKVYSYATPTDEVIVYCGGSDCEDSREVFDLLREAGFTHLRLYLAGWYDWRKAGMEIETAAR